MLEGKTALVTGASRGIGRACAEALGRAGAAVAVTARSEADLELVCKGIGDMAVAIVADLSTADAPDDVAARAVAALGGVDILVNNAGMGHSRRSEKLSAGEIDDVVAMNVRAPLLMCARLAPQMADRGGGSIINVSSLSSLLGVKYLATYAATKGAVDAMTRALSIEWGGRGVRINSVAPGLIDTKMWEAGRAVDGHADKLEQMVSLGRWGEPLDIADPVVFLASDAARYITGQTLVIDGGLGNVRELLPRT